MATNDSKRPGLDPIVSEAIDRCKICIDFEADASKHFIEDLKFAEADAYNQYQWPGNIRKNREVDDKPTLTINKVRQHNNKIINDAKQNKPGILVRATGGGASFQSAQILSGLIRHIEYNSSADTVYNTATEFQVKAGRGEIRVATDYEDDESFNQVIKIERIRDPLTVKRDPDARELDKSDQRFVFVLDKVPNDLLWGKYPQYKNKVSSAGGVLAYIPDWTDEHHTLCAEYWKRDEIDDQLYAIRGVGGLKVIKKSLLKEALDAAQLKELEDDSNVIKRDITTIKVKWYFLIGDKKVDEKDWPGKYIPIIPMLGEETIIDGKLDQKGHTRALLDPQRMYNYWASAAVEFGALQTKTPWQASVEAIAGFEQYYETANRTNHSWLPYRKWTQEGKELEKPTRVEPPVAAPVALAGMQQALLEFGLASGQYEPQFGQQSNERTGAAKFEGQVQSDNATYHFVENRAVAIRQVGRVVLDLIPHIYDTPRAMQILAMDDQPIELIIDPQMQAAYQERKNEEGVVVSHALNPRVGKYEVQADAGPGYATKREQAFEAFKLILTQNPTLTAILGDILFRAGDFPHADEAAARLRRLVPKYALGEGPSPAEQALQRQVEELTKLLADNMEELQKTMIKLKGKEQQRDIDVYSKITERLNVLLKARLDAASIAVDAASGQEGEGAGSARAGAITQEDVAAIFKDLMPDVLGVELTPIIESNAPSHEQREELGFDFTPPQLPDMPGVSRDFAGRPFGRDLLRSPRYRPL